MATLAPSAPGTTSARISIGVRTGRVLSGLAIAFFLFDAGIKLAALPVVGETSAQLGWPSDAEFWRGMGLLLLGCTLLYAWPRTALLGAVLLTGWLGGALATHLRIGSPLFSHTMFAVYVGLLVWGGLWLRSPALRALMPLRQEA